MGNASIVIRLVPHVLIQHLKAVLLAMLRISELFNQEVVPACLATTILASHCAQVVHFLKV